MTPAEISALDDLRHQIGQLASVSKLLADHPTAPPAFEDGLYHIGEALDRAVNDMEGMSTAAGFKIDGVRSGDDSLDELTNLAALLCLIGKNMLTASKAAVPPGGYLPALLDSQERVVRASMMAGDLIGDGRAPAGVTGPAGDDVRELRDQLDNLAASMRVAAVGLVTDESETGVLMHFQDSVARLGEMAERIADDRRQSGSRA